jgi:uncharacterized membrane protein HdeD (DUF308 family)
MVILGVFGISMPALLTEFSMIYLAILLLVGGVVQLVNAFSFKGWKQVLLHVLLGIVYLVAGGYTIQSPARMSIVLTLFIGCALIAVGIVRLLSALHLRGTGVWTWPMLSGIIAVALGGLVLAEWPVSGLWFIGIFVGVELLLNGWSWIMVAFAIKAAGAAGE